MGFNGDLAQHQFREAHVHFGLLADTPLDVRFTPKSGHQQSVIPCPLCAMCGRLRVGKKNLRVADLVGAAMCSAFKCGSHDRWP
jgi:hypothetical protein